jgi:outer membrane lipoprotein carrier protein
MNRLIQRAKRWMAMAGLALAVLGSGLLPGVSPAAAADGDPVADLRHYFESVDTLEGAFTQTTRDERGEVIEEAEGSFVLARPERFVWEYRTPWEQVIVADGERLWVHDVALDQVAVRPLDEALGVGAAQLLSGDFATLQADFELSASESGGIVLKPTDPAWDFQRVHLELDAGVPVAVEVRDGMGQRVRVALIDVVRNPEVDPGRFDFEPPDGVDVMQGS